MNIIFVCKFNRFRSKIAEGLFHKYYKGKKHKAKSIGVIKGNRITKRIRRLAKEVNIPVKGQPQVLTEQMIQWADMFVIVADDVPSSVFKFPQFKKKHKIIRFEIPDGWKVGERHVDDLPYKIDEKMKKFMKRLN